MRKLNNSQVQQDTHLEELAALGRKEVAHYGHFPSGQAYMEHVNSNTIVIVQLEDIEVLENIDRIDFFCVGPTGYSPVNGTTRTTEPSPSKRIRRYHLSTKLGKNG